ncbi:MAG: hypothetical protein GY711_08220 [bacterium]|nr:hypothetical protein [bacterium]
MLFASCGGSGGDAPGSASSTLALEEVSNGFGQLVPHTIHVVDASRTPTSDIVAIRSMRDLTDNLVPGNTVLPVARWPESATLPNGQPGNHFLYARFTQPLAVRTVLDTSPGAQATAGFGGAVSVVAIDPITNTSLAQDPSSSSATRSRAST